ncbi:MULTISPECIES: hypothetical protein [Pontibacillus]|uniref:Uncharacterized protein n=1 Tax=Pontibacillus chungwhensis TaxID=265426 RepID=A0ABY8V0B0_9BACI|nr:MULTISPECIES: hypothetical protein [Pontibacillus]MCD5324326.1 hypothetical protein [Pontibacillus sp. HN14]WIF99377.1 hypothetical protein QNI29_06885 [Pontibacillus chungwhensis]
MNESKAETLEYLTEVVGEYRQSMDEDFLEVTLTSLKLITMLEEIVYHSKQNTFQKVFEPDYDLLTKQVYLVISKFNEGNMKKRVIWDIKDKALELIHTLHE